jgi:hypothetical protein
MIIILLLLLPLLGRCQFDGFKESVCLDASTWVVVDDGSGKVYLAHFPDNNKQHLNLYPFPFSSKVASKLVQPDSINVDPISKMLYFGDASNANLYRVDLKQRLSESNKYIDVDSVALSLMNGDVTAPKKMIIDPSGKYLFLSDQKSGCILVVSNLESFPKINIFTVTEPPFLGKPHGVTFLQLPSGDPSAEYRIGTKESGMRDYRRDVLFVANENCVSYVNVSSQTLRNIVQGKGELQVPNCTYDLSAHFNHTKVAIMSIWFQDEGSQLLCMSKSENCIFFSLQLDDDATTSSFFSDSAPTPMREISVRANATICPSGILDGHPHGFDCDHSGDFCLIAEPGEDKLGKLANLTWTSNEVSEITSISYTNYSNLSSFALWNDILDNIKWSNITQLKPVASDMFDHIQSPVQHSSTGDQDWFALTPIRFFEVAAVLIVFNVIVYLVVLRCCQEKIVASDENPRKYQHL